MRPEVEKTVIDTLAFTEVTGPQRLCCPRCRDVCINLLDQVQIPGGGDLDEEAIRANGVPYWLRADRTWVAGDTLTRVFDCERFAHQFAVQFGTLEGYAHFRVIVCPPGCDPGAIEEPTR